MNIDTNDENKCKAASVALLDVLDPEIGLNVIDLGLIYRICFDDSEQKIACCMTLTTQHCPMGESIMEGVRNALENTFPAYAIDVELTFDPPWEAEMISEAGRNFLNL